MNGRNPRKRRTPKKGVVPRAHDTTSPDALARRDRDLRALALRREGLTYEQIAQAVGLKTKQQAHDIVTKLLDEVLLENVDQYRAIENERLDALHNAFWSLALAADTAAADRILKIMERRARLNSLDMPPRAPVDGDGNTVGVDYVAILLARLARLRSTGDAGDGARGDDQP